LVFSDATCYRYVEVAVSAFLSYSVTGDVVGKLFEK
jgi:hypothetical protein